MAAASQQTRRERLEEREQTIIAAAYEEFLTHGRDGARMARIASRAGLAEGTIYLYFKNKQALAGAVVGRFYQRLTAAAAEGVAERSSTAERLGFLIRHHLKSCLKEWPVLELAVPDLWRVSVYRESEYFGFNRTYAQVFDQVIREGMARSDVSEDIPLHLLRDLFFGLMEHAMRTYLVHGEHIDDESAILEMAEQIETLILRALVAGRGEDQVLDGEVQKVARQLLQAAGRLEEIVGPP